jgi:hypothetical protein
MDWRLLLSSCDRAGSYAYARALRPMCSSLVGLGLNDRLRSVSSVFDELCELPVPADGWVSGSVVATTSEERWVDAILEICHSRRLQAFVPLGDPELLITARARSRFKKADIALLSVPTNVVETILDKGRVMKSAALASVPCPITLTDVGIAPEAIIARLGLPLVIKAQFSYAGEWVWLVQTAEDLQIKQRRLELLGRQAVIQQYIAGGIERSLHVLLDHKNREILSFVLRKRHHIRPSLSTSITLLPTGTEHRPFLKMAKSLHGPALYIFQLKQDAKSRQYKLIEVSSRPGTNWRILVPLLLQQGVNLPHLCLRAAFGESLQPIPLEYGVSACAPLDQCGAFTSYIRARFSCGRNIDSDNSLPSLSKFVLSWLASLSKPADVYLSALRDDFPLALCHFKSLMRLTVQTLKDPPTMTPWGDV